VYLILGCEYRWKVENISKLSIEAILSSEWIFIEYLEFYNTHHNRSTKAAMSDQSDFFVEGKFCLLNFWSIKLKLDCFLVWQCVDASTKVFIKPTWLVIRQNLQCQSKMVLVDFYNITCIFFSMGISETVAHILATGLQHNEYLIALLSSTQLVSNFS
jgi:hypothetical protein